MTNSNDALRAALEWYRDQMCEGFCEGFTPRICAATMSENPTGGDCAGCRAVLALNQPAAPVEAVEPVAWMYERDNVREVQIGRGSYGLVDILGWTETPLYAHPPEPAASTVAQGDQ